MPLIYKMFSLTPPSTAHTLARQATPIVRPRMRLWGAPAVVLVKVHAITDALGNPLDFVLTGGLASDIGEAETLLALTPAGAEAFVGDKGYDSDALVQAIQERDIKPVIPPRNCSGLIT